jgi:hypothetical protein
MTELKFFKGRGALRSVLGACMACTLALLIWTKLKMVYAVPRQAIADPDVASGAPKPKPPVSKSESPLQVEKVIAQPHGKH